ncbi:MAG: PTS sugar transporter subunit IIA [Treponema sp.]|nr:PTS sugar transporter subunit IIA [Treponema sp.]
MDVSESEKGLAELLKRGGIYRDIKGSTPREVLTDLAGALPAIPSVQADVLLGAVLEREALMSTSAGHGIALPHPRNPLLKSTEDQFVALAFLKNPVDWNSLDGKPVDTLLLIVSASSKEHLHTLSKINYLCRNENFRRLLGERAGEEELLGFIRETEKEWR